MVLCYLIHTVPVAKSLLCLQKLYTWSICDSSVVLWGGRQHQVEPCHSHALLGHPDLLVRKFLDSNELCWHQSGLQQQLRTRFCGWFRRKKAGFSSTAFSKATVSAVASKVSLQSFTMLFWSAKSVENPTILVIFCVLILARAIKVITSWITNGS